MSGAKDLHQLGVAALAKALAGREVSAVEAAQHFLGRMKAVSYTHLTLPTKA